jgi:hypothetical protein
MNWFSAEQNSKVLKGLLNLQILMHTDVILKHFLIAQFNNKSCILAILAPVILYQPVEILINNGSQIAQSLCAYRHCHLCVGS